MEDKLNIIKDGRRHIYYLNAKGREKVGCTKIRKSTGNVDHYIMRNTLYIAYGAPDTWKNEIKITSKGLTKKDTITNVCDALFTYENTFHIVEVDNTQSMAKNTLKMAKYRQIIERDLTKFNNVPPVFIWITTTELRRKHLQELCKGLVSRVFLISDFA